MQTPLCNWSTAVLRMRSGWSLAQVRIEIVIYQLQLILPERELRDRLTKERRAAPGFASGHDASRVVATAVYTSHLCATMNFVAAGAIANVLSRLSCRLPDCHARD